MSDKQQLFHDRVTRYLTALDVKKPDKIPIRPMFSEFCAKYAGFSLQEVYYDLDKDFASVDRVLEDFDLDVVWRLPACGGLPCTML